MTITRRVQQELSQARVPVELPVWQYGSAAKFTPDERVQNRGKTWTQDEHERFLEALELYPRGPWKVIAAYIGTKTTRQVMTHSQKCREKAARRQRALEYQRAHLEEAAATGELRQPVEGTATSFSPMMSLLTASSPPLYPPHALMASNMPVCNDGHHVQDHCVVLFEPPAAFRRPRESYEWNTSYQMPYRRAGAFDEY